MSQRLDMPWAIAFIEIDKHVAEPLIKTCIKSMVKTAYSKFSIQTKDINTRRRKLIDVNTVIAMVVCEQFRNLPLRVVGNIFRKNHATILHYKSNYENILCNIADYMLLHRELTDICVYERYGVVQEIVGKSKDELKAECMRLLSINRELTAKLNSIKEISYA